MNKEVNKYKFLPEGALKKIHIDTGISESFLSRVKCNRQTSARVRMLLDDFLEEHFEEFLAIMVEHYKNKGSVAA